MKILSQICLHLHGRTKKSNHWINLMRWQVYLLLGKTQNTCKTLDIFSMDTTFSKETPNSVKFLTLVLLKVLSFKHLMQKAQFLQIEDTIFQMALAFREQNLAVSTLIQLHYQENDQWQIPSNKMSLLKQKVNLEDLVLVSNHLCLTLPCLKIFTTIKKCLYQVALNVYLIALSSKLFHLPLFLMR